jgi:hypothetical protein
LFLKCQATVIIPDASQTFVWLLPISFRELFTATHQECPFVNVMVCPCGHSVLINLPDEVFSAFLMIAEAIIPKNRCFTFDRQPACKTISFEIFFTASNPTSFSTRLFHSL